MIGYHYTSEECWKRIQKQGLIPYSICKAGFSKFFGSDTVTGVWVWKNKPKGLSHAGSLIFQMAMKGVTRVVVLQVNYKKVDMLKSNGSEVSIKHIGEIQNLVYHRTEAAVIITKTIPRTGIKLLGVVDLLDVFPVF